MNGIDPTGDYMAITVKRLRRENEMLEDAWRYQRDRADRMEQRWKQEIRDSVQPSEELSDGS